MSLDVALTIVAPVSDSTTWTDVPTIEAPFAGWTTATTAGEDGRGALEAAPVGAAADGASVAPPPQAATIRAVRSVAARRDRDIIGTSWLHGEGQMDVDRSTGSRVHADHVEDQRSGVERDVRDVVAGF